MKKRKSGGGANWLDTYADMVTLLLCFFVMMYSMSTVDEEKWIALVQSFNPNVTIEENMIAGLTTEQLEEMQEQKKQEQVEVDIEKLYQSMAQYVKEAGLESQVSISKGQGYVFVSFDDTVFFDGDSYTLRDSGKVILDQIAQSIANVSGSIDEIRVLGHTAQARADAPNDPTGDRFLSSNRAAVVTVYLQEKNIIDPARLVSVGYGQWRPVASNENSQERAKNRRVELIITGLNATDEMGDNIAQYYTIREGDAVLNSTQSEAE